MLKRLRLLAVVILFAAPLFAMSSIVLAHDSPPSKPAAVSEDAPETSVQKMERETRVKNMKEQQKVRLTTAEKKNIPMKCQAAQGKVSAVGGRLKGIETSRSEVHAHLLTHLNELVGKLKLKGLDSTALEAAITALQASINTFNTDLALYKQSVSDLSLVDCKADPEGFKVALQTARTNLEKVRTDAKAVHTYLNETIKPLLKTLRAQVETGSDNQQGGTQ